MKNYFSKLSILDYWKVKTSNPSINGQNIDKGPLSIDIGGEVFDKIFGNSTVDIRALKALLNSYFLLNTIRLKIMPCQLTNKVTQHLILSKKYK